MPDDNASLADVEVVFPRLAEDLPTTCPVSLDDLVRHLSDEAPGGDSLTTRELVFLRTAQVEDMQYWVRRFKEPDGGEHAYATVAVAAHGSPTIGCEADYYGLTPEQFIVGDYHQVF
jgi:hypothetical protein